MAIKKGTSEEDFDAWRIGQKFTIVKFLQPLKDFNDAAKQAKYGMIPGEYIHPMYIIDNRIAGLDKMHFILKMLSYDVYFSMNKYQKIKLATIKKRLNIIEKSIPNVAIITKDHVHHTEKKIIKEDVFNVLFDTLLDLNSSMLDMMNQAGLIFRKNEEFDLDSFMEEMVHRG